MTKLDIPPDLVTEETARRLFIFSKQFDATPRHIVVQEATGDMRRWRSPWRSLRSGFCWRHAASFTSGAPVRRPRHARRAGPSAAASHCPLPT